ncbi:MAG: prolipoprotein diacylglyceryl transferase [Dysgonamonadaceae bacterium]|jgi:prolipoprotein diacylglyceryl transferase|nr:prolipoprotein diacylglyceryl transferase [Dysgonamonadaceae bacterium]
MILSYIHWNVDPEIVKIFGISLQYYGILFVGGLILAVYLLKIIFNTNKIPPEHLEKLTWYCFFGIFIGARLGHCLFYEPEYYLAHPLEMIFPIESKVDGGYEFIGYRGLASHGGAIGLTIALACYSWKTRQNLIKTLDFIAIVTPISACYIRLGNLMNSEIIGKQTDISQAFIFERVDNIPRHPAQLYEAIAYLIIFLINMYLYKRTKLLRNKGFFFGLTISLIFGFRFFIEFIKERQVEFEEFMKLDMGQILSIPFVIVGIGFIVYSFLQNKKTESKIQ